MTELTGLTVWGEKRSKRSKRSGQNNMRISELRLVAPDKEKRDSIPQNERSYAGIRCRGIEEREPNKYKHPSVTYRMGMRCV